MRSFFIECAGITVQIYCQYEFTQKKCEKYIVQKNRADIVIAPTHDELALYTEQLSGHTKEYIEFMTICYLVSDALLSFDRAIIHASAVAVDNKAYIFAAPSGTGKTTHTMLWKKNFAHRCTIINGDKPILSFTDNGIFVSGAPWCGKEGISNNVTKELHAVCFLEQGKTNKIEKITGRDITDRLFYQMLMPESSSGRMTKYIELANKLVKNVPFYLLKCNMKDEAATLCYETISKE